MKIIYDELQGVIQMPGQDISQTGNNAGCIKLMQIVLRIECQKAHANISLDIINEMPRRHRPPQRAKEHYLERPSA